MHQIDNNSSVSIFKVCTHGSSMVFTSRTLMQQIVDEVGEIYHNLGATAIVENDGVIHFLTERKLPHLGSLLLNDNRLTVNQTHEGKLHVYSPKDHQAVAFSSKHQLLKFALATRGDVMAMFIDYIRGNPAFVGVAENQITDFGHVIRELSSISLGELYDILKS